MTMMMRCTVLFIGTLLATLTVPTVAQQKATTVEVRIQLNETVTNQVRIDAICSELAVLGNDTCATSTNCTEYDALSCNTQNAGTTVYQNSHIISLDDKEAVDYSISLIKTAFENPSTVNQALEEALDGAIVTSGSLAVPVDFQYRIDYQQNFSKISFSEKSASEELVFKYNISDKPAQVTLYKPDCLESLPSTGGPLELLPLVRADGDPITFENVDVRVDVAQELIQNTTNGLWSYDASTNEGTITFCMKMSLYYDEAFTTSLNFHETRVEIKIDMKTEFAVEAIDTDRENATSITEETKVEYNLQAYKCDWSGAQNSESLSQGDVLFLCVQSFSGGVKLEKVSQLALTQEGANGGYMEPIQNGNIVGLADVDCSAQDNTKCIIRTIAVSSFFTQDNTNDIEASGEILLSFGRRRARTLLSFHVDANGEQTGEPRTLLEDSSASGSGAFSLNMKLKLPTEVVQEKIMSTEGNSINIIWVVGGAVCLVGLFVMVMNVTYKSLKYFDGGGLVKTEKKASKLRTRQYIRNTTSFRSNSLRSIFSDFTKESEEDVPAQAGRFS